MSKYQIKISYQASGFSAVTKVIEKLPGPLKEVPSSNVRPAHHDGGSYGDNQCGNGDLDEIIIWIIMLTSSVMMIVVYVGSSLW